jgi:hypothetical protein
MEVALASILALLLAAFAAMRARRDLRLLEKYEHCMDMFIKDANTLLADKDTPRAIVEILAFLRQKATSGWAALDFLKHLLSKDRKLLRESKVRQEIQQFVEQRQELGAVFNEACAAAICAMAYRANVGGGIMRSLVFFDAREHSIRTRDIATKYSEVEKHHTDAHAAVAA